MLDNVNEQAKKLLIVLRKKGDVVNRLVAVATAKPLISRSDNGSLKSIDIKNSSWAPRVFT